MMNTIPEAGPALICISFAGARQSTKNNAQEQFEYNISQTNSSVIFTETTTATSRIHISS